MTHLIEYAKSVIEKYPSLTSDVKDLVNLCISEIEEGLGFSYIKARLEESYPGKWNIEYGLKNGFWETCIKIKN